MRIRWTDSAVRDLTAICDYINEHSSGRIARQVAHAIHNSFNLLQDFPEMGRRGRKADTRELVFAGLPYVAIYRIREDVIEVLRILHGAQIWP